MGEPHRAVRLRHGIGDGVQLLVFHEWEEAEIRRTRKFIDELWRARGEKLESRRL